MWGFEKRKELLNSLKAKLPAQLTLTMNAANIYIYTPSIEGDFILI